MHHFLAMTRPPELSVALLDGTCDSASRGISEMALFTSHLLLTEAVSCWTEQMSRAGSQTKKRLLDDFRHKNTMQAKHLSLCNAPGVVRSKVVGEE